MTVHVSARLPWHDSGWDGRICRDPKGNTYCVGPYSFPADFIARERNLEWEAPLAGCPCAGLDDVPPCMYSVNAFGDQPIRAYVDPPAWFNDSTQRREFVMLPYSVVFLVVWTLFLLAYWKLGIPLGPAAPYTYPAPG